MTSSTPVRTENRLLDDIVEQYRSKGYHVSRNPGRNELPPFLSAFQPDLLASNATEHVVVEVKNKAQLTHAGYLTELSRVVNAEPGWRFELIVAPVQQTPIRDGGRDIGLEGALTYLEHSRELLTIEQPEAALLLAWAATEAVLREVARRYKVVLEREQPSFVMNTLFSLGLLGDKEYEVLQEGYRSRSLLAHGYAPPTGQLVFPPDLIRVAEGLLQSHNGTKDGRITPKKSIYAPLSDFLEASDAPSLTLDFKNLETILNRSLPVSARNHKQWWDNSEQSRHAQAKSWLDVGWRVTRVDLVAEKITFKKGR